MTKVKQAEVLKYDVVKLVMTHRGRVVRTISRNVTKQPNAICLYGGDIHDITFSVKGALDEPPKITENEL